MAEQPAQKEYKTVDIVDFSMQGKPIKVNDVFGQLISDKVVTSLANKKQEISAKMFADKEEEPILEPEAETTEEQ